MEAVIFLDSQINADGDRSHEIKSCLLLGRKAMTNLYNVLKSRDITLPINVPIVKAVVFPVVMLNVRVVPYRRLSGKKSVLLNCGVGEDS